MNDIELDLSRSLMFKSTSIRILNLTFQGHLSSVMCFPVIQSPDGQQTTVIYTDQGPRYYRNDGTDMAMGFMAGAAMGSLMFTPLLWWW